jgi:vacuolar protein sorting-associated protein 29
MQTAELVLVIGDLYIPDRADSIPEVFIKLLSNKKFQHILCTGNIGNKETDDWLQTLLATPNISKVSCVKSLSDDSKLKDKEIIKVGDFKIGLICSSLIVPSDDIEMLSYIQKQLDVDIVISGGTGKSSIMNLDGKYLLNSGSLTGAYSYLGNNIPSFILLAINGDFGMLYLYELNKSTNAVECFKMELLKNIIS